MNRLPKYIWLVDTIRRYGPITRERISRMWADTPFYAGEGLSRRTFYNYREAIEQIFNIRILCDPRTYEYSIADDSDRSESISDWLLNAAATNEMLSSSRDLADRIFVEDVPSARNHLATAIQALRGSLKIKFDYHPYTRSKPTPDVVLDPYFLKIFRQRWYLTGLNNLDRKIKTYALDRMTKAAVTDLPFIPDPSFDPRDYFRHSFGIVVTAGEPRKIVLRTDPRQAKYFRALPLHHSQSEMVHDKFSIFTYKMRLSQDLVEEILSHGPRVTVLEPPELKLMVRKELREALDNYQLSTPPADAPSGLHASSDNAPSPEAAPAE